MAEPDDYFSAAYPVDTPTATNPNPVDRPEGYYGGQLHLNITKYKNEPKPPEEDYFGSTYKPTNTPPPKQDTPDPDQIGSGASLWQGVKQGATFGFSDELAGILAASGYAHALPYLDEVDRKDITPENYGTVLKQVYEKARDVERSANDRAQQQHPGMYIGGNLAGAMVLPVGAGMSAATLPARMGRGLVTGTVTGGLTGVGEGTDATSRAIGGGIGAGVGGVVGGLLPGAGVLAKYAADKTGVSAIPSVLRTALNVDKEANRRISAHFGEDAASGGRNMTPADVDAARLSGQPVTLADTGGESTRALLDSAVTQSPAARNVARNFIDQRYEGQVPRTKSFINNLMGGTINSVEERESLEQAARAANGPAYRAAYAAGSDGKQFANSEEIQRLLTSNSLPRAMVEAIKKGRDRAVADRMGGFNPKVSVTPDGQIKFNKGADGVPIYPDLQFWDYTHRALRDEAKAAARTGHSDQAGAVTQIANNLRDELDKIVPSFKDARSTAAKYFDAEDALEAGKKFVNARGKNDEFRAVIKKMSDPERKLFADGFASEILGRVREYGDRENVINKLFVNSDAARERIEMALGRQKATEYEMFMRRESMLDKLREVVGNSKTAQRQIQSDLASHAKAGGMGIMAGGAEALLQGELSVRNVVMFATGVTFVESKNYIQKKLAHSIAEKLMSTDPNEWQSVMTLASKNSKVRDYVRTLDGTLTRMIGNRAGDLGSAAAASSQNRGAQDNPAQGQANQ